MAHLKREIAIWVQPSETMGFPGGTAAAAAKSLQSCPTPRNPMDCSLPGFSIHGICQARVLEWVAVVLKKKKQKQKQKKQHCQCRKHRRRGFDPLLRKILQRRSWQFTPVFLSWNPMDKGAWWATVHGVTQSQTQLK